MGDSGIQLSDYVTQRASSAPSPPAAAPGLMSKATAHVVARPKLALAVIVLLVILVIYLVVYYRGLFIFGPYAVGAAAAAGARKRKRAPVDDEDDPGDAETEKLIQTINSA